MNTTLTLWQRMVQASRSPALALTFSYYAAFIALGLTNASLGPTLLGLAEQTGSPLSQISFLFTARALGYLIGSFTGGRAYDRLPGHRTMAAALVGIALLLALVPTIPLLWLLIVVMLAIGFTEAVIDVGGNALIVWVHRDKVGPYMNGLHLFFAVGTFLAPLLIAQVILWTGSFGAGYWLLALLVLPVALRVLPLPDPQPLVTREEKTAVRPNLVLLVLIVFFFVFVTASETSFGGWVFTYAVRSGLTSETTAAYLNAAFWGAFMVGRLASIPIAARVRPRLIILGDLVLAVAGLILLLVLSQSVAALWVGAILFGLGIASAFPTMLTFAGRHMTMTGAVTGWFFVGASLGGIVLPPLIGQLFDTIGPIAVPMVITTTAILALVVFLSVLAFLARTATRGAYSALP